MAIDFTEDPRGVQLQLLIERAKYERHISAELATLLERSYNDLVDRILSREFRELTLNQRARTLALFRELDTRIKAGYVDVAQLHLKELTGYAQLEADVARVHALSVVGGSVGITLGPSLPKSYLQSIAKLPIQGLDLGAWFDAQAFNMSVLTRRTIQQGLVEGKGTAEIARQIARPLKSDGPMVYRRALSEAKIISRTAVNAIQNNAALKGYESLPVSVSDSYRWLSVRDARTTIICAALDGRVWRYDDPDAQIPPAHLGCRSSIAPVLKGGDLSEAEQRNGPMALGSYATWLREQNVTTQNDILGATRAQLFRDGRMQLADAIDADNRVLTLPELRARLGLDGLSRD
jgi:SPP1 gp7 family putative phage head morphogenesis protein